MADFEIRDGSPWWMSPDIFIRNDPSETYTATADEPVTGGYQNPIEKQDNCIYVRVWQHGALVTGQTAKLHLYVARGGPEFRPTSLNPITPTACCANLIGNDVAEVPFTYVEDLVETEVIPLELGVHDVFPGPDTFRWYKFKWKPSLVPCDAETLGWHPCLLAWVETTADDVHYDPSQPVSADPNLDNNFAQRNLTVIHSETKTSVKRTVVLGNQRSFERRLGVVVRLSGTAAAGATVTLRFTRAKLKLPDRIALPAKLPRKMVVPASTWYRRPPRGLGLPELRDAPPAWNVTPIKGGFVFKGPEAGLTIPVLAGETLEVELEMTPGRTGNQLVVDLAQNDGSGRVVGGVSFDLQY